MFTCPTPARMKFYRNFNNFNKYVLQEKILALFIETSGSLFYKSPKATSMSIRTDRMQNISEMMCLLTNTSLKTYSNTFLKSY